MRRPWNHAILEQKQYTHIEEKGEKVFLARLILELKQYVYIELRGKKVDFGT